MAGQVKFTCDAGVRLFGTYSLAFFRFAASNGANIATRRAVQALSAPVVSTAADEAYGGEPKTERFGSIRLAHVLQFPFHPVWRF